jgi:hypothetical protein
MNSPLLIAEPPFQVLPALAGAIGFNEAAVIQVIHFWLNPQNNNHFREGRYWVPNIFNQLYERFFFWDVETIDYMITQLEQSGILMVFQELGGMEYHTINYELLKGEDGAPIQFVPAPSLIQDTSPRDNKTKANKNRLPSFKMEIHRKGHNLYTMIAQDLSHFLECELILEIKENVSEREEPEHDKAQEVIKSRDVICHFPKLASEQFRKFVWHDVALHRILRVMFEMKIMKQLLAFCATHHASNLVIFSDDEQADGLEIYRDFLTYKDWTFTPIGEKREVIIPADRETLDDWNDFMEVIALRFRQTLWREQKTNPAIQHYLQSRPLSEF